MLMSMVRDAAEDEVSAAVALRRHSRDEEANPGAASKDWETKVAAESGDGEPSAFLGGGAGRWQYAVVLTKVDKGGLKAVRKAEAMVRKAIDETGCPEPLGIVVTSASKRVGRGDIWRLMRRMVLTGSDDEGAKTS